VAAGDARQDELTRFSREVPQAELRVIDGAGHDVLNDGGPDVVRAIGEWLVASGAAASG
jgi:pimeloyl-ACP methyl ester carboxylesterase